MNLAFADVSHLAEAVAAFYRDGDGRKLHGEISAESDSQAGIS